MAIASDIRDRESLLAWLKGRTREESVWIAQRAALRVAPVVWARPLRTESEIDLTTLVVCRCLLTAGVAVKMPTPAVRDAAARATDANFASDAARASAAARADAARASAAARAAARAADATIATDAARAAAAAAAAARAAAGETRREYIWRKIREDALSLERNEDQFSTRLWSIPEPNWFLGAEDDFRRVWQGDPAFSFWLRWWDGVVSGEQLPWDLQEKVALIPDEIWQQGPAAVAEEIAGIELEFAERASPNAEDIIVNDEGRYDVVARSDLPARTLRDARDRIGDTIRLIRGGEVQNQHAALLPEAALLQEVLDRYGENALRLHEVCHKVVRHVGLHVASGVLPEADNVVADVMSDLQHTADDIYNFDEEVRRTVDARAKLRFNRLDDAQKEQVEQLALAVAGRSTPELAAELREDAAVVRSEGEPTDDTALGRYRLGSRLVRVATLGGKMFKDVTEALCWVSGVAGGIGVLAGLLLLLLGLL